MAYFGSRIDSHLLEGVSHGETRCNSLKVIDASNGKTVALVWSYEIGEGGGDQEAHLIFCGDLLDRIDDDHIHRLVTRFELQA